MKIFASAVLTVMVLPFFVWAGTSIVDHGRIIARLDEREKTTKELLIEVRQDVKAILKAQR